MKITFLMHSVDRIGGITRATLTTAAAMAARGHQVQIAAVFRESAQPGFSIDPRIQLTRLMDAPHQATAVERDLAAVSSAIYPPGDTFYATTYTRLTDKLVGDFLRGNGCDIVIGTTPGINVYVSRFAPPGAISIAQEHLVFDKHSPDLRDDLSQAIHHLDAMITVTRADAASYRRRLPALADKVSFIPNPVASPSPHPAAAGKTIIAAGRLTASKNYTMLLDAFAIVHERYPNWRLHLYGQGDETDALETRIEALRLRGAARLMGQVVPMDTVWSSGAIAAVSSDYESFGLTIVEAMLAGLPVVSTHCRTGPPEIITHGVDGLLTPVGDAEAFAAALCEVIADDARRERMSRAARATGRRYAPDRIVAEYEALFHRLRQAKYGPASSARPTKRS